MFRPRRLSTPLTPTPQSPTRANAGFLVPIVRVVSAGILIFQVTMPSLIAQDSLPSLKTQVPFRSLLIQGTPLPRLSANASRYIAPSGSDRNDGGKEHPWATITHAGSVAVPGMVIHVTPGRYAEAVVTSASGTATARIVYVSDQDWDAVILAPGQDGFAWNNTGNYSDIIGFEISGGRCGGVGLGGSFQRAISNQVHNSAAGCSTSDGGSGINDYNYATEGNDIVRNYVYDIGAREPSCGQFRHNYIQGIYQANAGGHIEQNVVVNSCGFGIHLWHAATRAAITNNTVVGNKAGGILVGAGDAPCSTIGCPGGNDFTIVRNNIVAFNGNPVSGGWGISERSQVLGPTGMHNEYSHNLSFKNLSGDFSIPATNPCRNCVTGKDPQFVSGLSGDYRLSAGSPAIGAGKKSDQSRERQAEAYKGAPLTADIGALPFVRTAKQ
jgi:pectate disaccharide-lyase